MDMVTGWGGVPRVPAAKAAAAKGGNPTALALNFEGINWAEKVKEYLSPGSSIWYHDKSSGKGIRMRTEVFQMEAKHVKDMMEAFVKELIENHKDIEIIEIDTTNNGNEIASALAKALVVEPGKEAPLPKLRSLNLSGSVDIYTVASQVGVRGTKDIARALRSNTTLRYLQLSNNEIKNEGARALASCLIVNSTLQGLNLWKNGQITHIGIEHLIYMLSRNHTFADLNLFKNEYSRPETLKKLAEALTYNISLTTLSLDKRVGFDKHFKEMFQWNLTLRKMESQKEKGDKILEYLNQNDKYQTQRAERLQRLQQRKVTLADAIQEEYRAYEQLGRGVGSLNLSDFPIPDSVLPPRSIRPNLVVLHLSRCGLTRVPLEIFGATNLERLNLAINCLTAIPGEIGRLKKLHTLDLGFNQLTADSLPIELGDLPLRNLYLHCNRLTKAPLVLERLATLEILDLQSNQLTTLPDELYMGCTSLRYLHLTGNLFVNFSPAITNLKRLELLWAGSNKLDFLPVEMHRMRDTLKSLELDNNPLQSLRGEALQAPDKLWAELERLEAGSERYMKVKLMFVGEGNVGKTTLLEELCKNKSKAEQPVASAAAMTASASKVGMSATSSSGRGTLSRVSSINTTMKRLAKKYASTTELPNVATDGIDIRSWKDPDTGIKFRSWDFAGQEVYYLTHQFFLTKTRAIYLVMFRLDRVIQDGPPDPGNPQASAWATVEYWLQSLEARANDCCVVLVGTHRDDEVVTREALESVVAIVERLRQRYRMIEDFHAISKNMSNTIKHLKESLGKLALSKKMVGYQVPSSYVLLAKQLNAMRKRFRSADQPAHRSVLPWAEFRSLALQFNVPEDSLTEAASFLNQVGELVYFQEEHTIPYVFMDPQWLTDMMSTVFTYRHKFGRDGRLKKDALPQIWKEPEYPARLHPVMIRLLTSFELIYPLPPVDGPNGREEVFLIPHWLPEERPWLNVFWPLAYDGTSYGRRYDLQFFPTGLFSRLMIRLLHFTRGTLLWRSGCLLELNGDTALLEANVSTKQITLMVRGKQAPAKLLRILLETLEALITNWFQIERRKFACCSHCLRKRPTAAPTWFELAELEIGITEGKREVVCMGQSVRLEDVIPDVMMKDIGGVVIDFEKELVLEKPLGKGAFGIIYKGNWRGEVVAVKMLMLPQNVSPEDKAKAYNEFRQEVWLMSGLSHPNIVSLKGYCIEPNCMVMDFVPHGDLYAFIHDERVKEISWPLRLKIAHDISKGMQFLHGLTPPLLHRDLKSPNVLMNALDERAPVCAKVADFGLSSLLFISAFREKTADRAVANPTWLAPEVMSEEEYSEKSDVYAHAIMMHELLTRQHPYDEFGWKYMWMLEEGVRAGHRPSFPPDCLPRYRALIEDAWHPKPSARPTFAEITRRLEEIIADTCPELFNYDPSRHPELLQPSTHRSPTVPADAAAPAAPAVSPTDTSVSTASTGIVLSCTSTDSLATIPGASAGSTADRLPAEPSSSSSGAGDLPSGSSGELLNMKLKDASSSPPRTDDIRQSDMQSSRKDKKKKKKKKKRENNEKREKKEKRSKREGSPAEGEKAGEKPRHRSAKGQNLIVPSGSRANSRSLTGEDRTGSPLPSSNLPPPRSPSPASHPTAGVAADSNCTSPPRPAGPSAATVSPRVAPASSVPAPAASTPAPVSAAELGRSGPPATLEGRVILQQTLESPRIHCMIRVGMQLWAGCGDGTVHILSATNGEPLDAIPRAHFASVTGLVLVGDRVWSASLDKTIRIWAVEDFAKKDPSSLAREKQLQQNRSANVSLQMTKAGRKTEDKFRECHAELLGMRLQVFKKQGDKKPEEELYIADILSVELRDGKKPRTCLHLAARGCTFLFAFEDPAEASDWLAAIDIRRRHKKRAPLRTVTESDKVTCLYRDGDRVYSACSNFVISIRDANSTDARVYGEKKLETSILSANSQITCMLRPHGSDHIWVGAGRTILRLKAQTAEPVDVLQGHDDQVNSLCDVEGREVWSASSDGSIIVWDARTGKSLQRIRTGRAPVTHLSFIEGTVWCAAGGATASTLTRANPSAVIFYSTKTYESTKLVVDVAHKDFVSSVIFLPEMCAVWSSSWDSSYAMWG